MTAVTEAPASTTVRKPRTRKAPAPAATPAALPPVVPLAVEGTVLYDILTGVIAHAGKDDTLPTLNAVYFTFSHVARTRPDGVNVQEVKVQVGATDRYTLGIDHAIGEYVFDAEHDQPLPEPVSILLPLRDADALAKRVRKSRFKVLLTLSDIAKGGTYQRGARAGKLTVNDYEVTSTYRNLDGEFPDIARLLPTEQAVDSSLGVAKIAFNPAYLAKFAKVRSGGPCPPARFYFTEDRKPALVKIGETFIGLIMPVRDGC